MGWESKENSSSNGNISRSATAGCVHPCPPLDLAQMVSPNRARGGSFQVALRAAVIACTAVGAVTMITSHQSVTIFGIVMEARYSYSSSLRFKLGADCAVFGLTLVSMILFFALNLPKSNPRNYFYLFLLDLVSLLLLVSGCSAATAIGYIGQYGQVQSGWIPVCDRVHKFCHQTTISVASSFLAVVCLLILTVISPYNLQSTPSSY